MESRRELLSVANMLVERLEDAQNLCLVLVAMAAIPLLLQRSGSNLFIAAAALGLFVILMQFFQQAALRKWLKQEMK